MKFRARIPTTLANNPSIDSCCERPIYYFISFSDRVREDGSALTRKMYAHVFLMESKGEESAQLPSCPEMSCCFNIMTSPSGIRSFKNHFLKEMEEETNVNQALPSRGPGAPSVQVLGGWNDRAGPAPGGFQGEQPLEAVDLQYRNHRVHVLTMSVC